MTRIGYARVSTDDQDTRGQQERLSAAGCERVYHDDGVSGTLASRPEWDACLAYLRPGDQLVAVKLDRIGRSVRNLLELAHDLEARGIDIVCLDQPIDTTTPHGKMFFTILAAFAAFERDLIADRTRAGLAATTRRGRNGGRKPKLKPYQVAHARSLIGTMPVGEIAAELGVSRATLYRSLEKVPA